MSITNGCNRLHSIKQYVFQAVTEATTECSVHRRVEMGVKEVHATPLTVPVSVYQDGNHRCVKKEERILQVILIVRLFFAAYYSLTQELHD